MRALQGERRSPVSPWGLRVGDCGCSRATLFASLLVPTSPSAGRNFPAANGQSIGGYFSDLRFQLGAQLVLVIGELRLDVLLRLAFPDDLFTIPSQEVVDGLDANLD